MKKLLLPCLAVFILCCHSISSEKTVYHIEPVQNPVFYSNLLFRGSEDLDAPKFAALKKTYQLDTVFHGEKNELKRILLLRHWISSHIPIDNIGPYPGDGSPESIVNEGMKGHGFHCGHFMRVQNAIRTLTAMLPAALVPAPA